MFVRKMVSVCLAVPLCAQLLGCMTEPDAGDAIGDQTEVSQDALIELPGATIGSSIAKLTVFSGGSPQNETFGKSYTLNQALTGLKGWEHSDEPCKIAGTFRNVETGVSGTTLSIDRCDGGSPGSEKSAVLPDGHFVTEARVCLNSAGDKIKGISVTGNTAYCIAGGTSMTLDVQNCTTYDVGSHEYTFCEDGVEVVPCSDIEETRYFERTNCVGDNDGPDGDWETIIKCNAGQVVTRVNLATTDEAGAKESFKGIQLECHTLSD